MVVAGSHHCNVAIDLEGAKGVSVPTQITVHSARESACLQYLQLERERSLVAWLWLVCTIVVKPNKEGGGETDADANEQQLTNSSAWEGIERYVGIGMNDGVVY